MLWLILGASFALALLWGIYSVLQQIVEALQAIRYSLHKDKNY